jgi:hypothetical protein
MLTAQTTENKMKAYDVFLNGVRIDRVFFNSDDTDEVRRSLIEWDNYDSEITVTAEEKTAQPA